MKQTIRVETFETNSSSYHTLSIKKVQNITDECKIIEQNKDLVIDANIHYKTIGYTDSYSYTARTNYEKAQLVLRFLGSALEDQLEDSLTDEEKALQYEAKMNTLKEKFYDTPLIKAFINAIKKYIGETHSVTIVLDKGYTPFYDVVYDSNYYTYEIFNVSKDDLVDIDVMADIFYNIIFTNDYEITEECESNE